MALSKEQIEDIELKMAGLFGRVTLLCGDDKITLHKSQLTQSKLGILVYINGGIAFGWGDPQSEVYNPLTEKLWRTRKVSVCKPKEKERLTKVFGKRGVRKHFPSIDKVRVFYDPIYPSFAPLKAKLKRIQELELQIEDKVA